MKGIPQLTASQTQPANPGNAVNSPASHNIRRTRKYFPGALLFLAFIATVGVGSASQSTKTTSPEESTLAPVQAAVTPASNEEPSQTTTNNAKDTQTMSNQSSKAGGVSTSVTNNNGEVTVKVNGETVVSPSDQSASKTVTTDNGNTVQVNVSQDQTNTGSGTSYNSSFSSSTNNYWSFSSGSTHVSGSN